MKFYVDFNKTIPQLYPNFIWKDIKILIFKTFKNFKKQFNLIVMINYYSAKLINAVMKEYIDKLRD